MFPSEGELTGRITFLMPAVCAREVPSVLGVELLMEQCEEICVLLWLYVLYR